MSAPATTPSSDTIPRHWGRAFFWGLVGFSLFGLLGLWMLRIGSKHESSDAQRGAQRVENLKKLQEADLPLLTTTGWIDKKAGTLHIPIDQAIKLELPVLQAKPIHPAYPINAPAVVAPPAAPATSAPVSAATAPPTVPTPAAAPTSPATSPTPTAK